MITCIYLLKPKIRCSRRVYYNKKMKNELGSTILQGRLNSLSLMAIENELLRDIKFETLINDFVNKKTRKVLLVSV